MFGKSTLRTGNDGIQIYFRIHSSTLDALTNLDGLSADCEASPVGDNNSRHNTSRAWDC
jgi:hypothetical protein